MSENFNFNKIVRKNNNSTDNLNNQPSSISRGETAEIEGNFFVSATGKHKTKMVVPQSNNTKSNYDYLKGSSEVDISRYSIGDQSKATIRIETNRVENFEIEEEPIIEEPVKTYVPNIDLERIIQKNEEIINQHQYAETKEESFDNYEAKNDESFENYEDDDSYDNYQEEVEDKEAVVQEIKTNSFDNFGSNYKSINYEQTNKLDSDFDWEKHDEKPLTGLENFGNHKSKSKKYVVPSFSDLPKETDNYESDDDWITKKVNEINEVFEDFDVGAKVVGKIVGPTVTQFLVELDPGTKVNEISNILSNIQINLCLDKDANIRFLDRVPNTKYVAIEVPNKKRRIVTLSELLDCKEFKENNMFLPIAVGKDIQGKNIYCDILEMPHCLICGTTRSGKSVCLNTIILSLIYKLSPSDLRFIFVDPKQVELSTFDGIPHLICPVITDFEYLKPVLKWLFDEMERRYTLLRQYNVRELKQLNIVLQKNHQEKVPFIVFVMDEFAQWISDGGREMEDLIQKLASKARGAGIHLVLAAQRPSSDLIKGSIKSQFDTRFAFKVTSFEDSKIIIGGSGAEKLVGKGDLLLKYAGSEPDRIQACYISNDNLEITNIVEKLIATQGTDYLFDLDNLNRSIKDEEAKSSIEGFDEMTGEVARYIAMVGSGSMQKCQERFGFGWPRTKRIFSDLEMLNIIGPAQKGRSQDLLVTTDQLEDILARNEIK